MVHTSLDGAGMFPALGIFADLANVVVYAVEGDVVGMGTAALSAIPGVGQGVTVAKYGKKGMDAAEAAGKALSKKEGKEAAEAAASKAAKDTPTSSGGGSGGPPDKPPKKTDEPEPEEPKKPKKGNGKDGGYVEGKASGNGAESGKNPLDGTVYTDKVKRQMEGKDLDHNFPSSIDEQAGSGKVKTIVGGDGIERTKVELPGNINGKEGNYSWIIEPDKSVNHRQFERLRKK